MSKHDYTEWRTKAQVAQQLECSTKQVERYAHAGRLQSRMCTRPEGGPRIVIYHPNDVDLLAQELDKPFVVAAPQPAQTKQTTALSRPSANGSRAVALPPAADLLRSLAEALTQAREHIAGSPFMTIQQAALYSGLGVG